MPLLINQLPALSIRLVTPWKGVWFADVDVALDETGIVPVGPCVLTIGTALYLGTVDPRVSGSFAKSAKLRVLAGGGGWHKSVIPLHLHNPAAVLSTAVYSATAAEVGEVVIDLLPKPLGQDYARCAGPASSVFGADVDWYMTPQGVTTVGPRVPIPYDPTSVDILSLDKLARTVELASDAPIIPGTILIDPLRFSGALVVRDVEQTWGAGGGARATAWISDATGSRLQTAIAALVNAKARTAYLKTYRYRVVLQDPASEALVLQIMDPSTGGPPALPFSMWMGVPGFGAKLLLGSEVIVSFINGDPTQPAVVAFKSGQYPVLLEIGTGLGGPLALATGTQAQLTAITVAIAALATYVAAVTNLAATIPAFPAYALAMAAPGNVVATALAGVTAAVAALVPAATSTRVVSD